MRLLVLPADPEADSLDDRLWAWTENVRVLTVGGGKLGLGMQKVLTAHAAALTDRHGSLEPRRSYVAIQRSGVVEYGLGARGPREGKDNKRQPGACVSLYLFRSSRGLAPIFQ